MSQEEVPCTKACASQNRCQRVSNKGQIYRCAYALAAAYQVKPDAVYQALSKEGHTERLGRPRGGRNHRRPVQIGRFSWPSVSALASDLNMDRTYVNRLLNHDLHRLLALVMKKKTA